MVIQHNMSSLFASNQLGKISGLQQKSTEKLTSGYRINRSADDAAGLSISERMRKQIRGLNRASDNVQDGISFAQVADGALSEIQDMMQRMTELCVQAANDTNSPQDRAAINREIQQLKIEMSRTFSTTDFNSHKIWSADINSRAPIPNTSQPVLNRGRSNSITITNDNVGTVSKDTKYTISSTVDTITIDWTGLDGGKYQATYPFEDFRKTGTFTLENTTMYNASTQTYDPIADNKKLDYSFSYGFADLALDEEISDALNNSTFRTGSLSVDMSLSSQPGVSGVPVSSMSISIGTTYESHKQTSNDNDTVAGVDYSSYVNSALTALTSNGTNLSVGNDSDPSQWSFTFNAEDHGTLTAKATSLSYYSNTYTGDKGAFWNTDSNGNKYTISHSINSGNIESVKQAINGSSNGSSNGSPGLKTAGVDSGIVAVSFTLYDTDGSTNIGGFTISASYQNGDSADDIAKKFTDSLNSNTILTPGTMNMSLSSGIAYYGNGKTIPQYESMLGMIIQTGDVAGDEIEIQYKSLSLANIGLSGLNTDTKEDALDGLDMVSHALEEISSQRATFGAYQNRLEHTYANNTNTAENVQAAESRIRDTDMTEEMMKLSVQNILAQTGQSMLTQANNSVDYIASLLQ